MPKNAIYPLEQAYTGIYGHRIHPQGDEAPNHGRENPWGGLLRHHPRRRAAGRLPGRTRHEGLLLHLRRQRRPGPAGPAQERYIRKLTRKSAGEAAMDRRDHGHPIDREARGAVGLVDQT